MWSADIFEDADLTRPSMSWSFETYDELRDWLVKVIAEEPAKDLHVSFRVPIEATAAQLKHLRILGPTKFVSH